MSTKHTFKTGDPLNTKCLNCNLNCQELYDIFRKNNKFKDFFLAPYFINKNVPCLTKEEWMIKELLE